MPSLKVSHRLLIGFLVILVMVAGLAWMVHATSAWQDGHLNELRQASVEASEHAAGMAIAARSAHAATQALLARRTPAAESGEVPSNATGARASRNAIDEALAGFDQHLARSRDLAAIEGRATVDRVSAIASAFATYRQLISAFVDADGASEGVSSTDMFEAQVRPHFETTLLPLVSRHQTATQAALAERVEAASSARRWSMFFLMGASLLLLGAVVVVAFMNARYVHRGLERAVATARTIAAGRTSNPIRVTSDDEFGDLADAFNDMVSRLSTATVSKTYVENIVQSMADPLVVVDPDVRIAMVNQALLDVLGYESDELTGASVTRIFAHTGRQRGAAIKQDIERGLAGNVESRFKTKAGQEVAISLSSALVRAGGEVQGLVIVAKDITEQKRRERELIDAKDEAERMVQLRDAFLANMSHEIRTPLTGILGSAQVLAEVVQGEHRNLARIIEDAGHRLLDTINSVLEMARIEAGEVQPEMEILDFAEEAEAVANVLRPVAEKKGLVLRVYPPSSGRVAAQIDRSCLNRILNNLVGNAIKFTREGAVSIEVSSDGDDAILTVRDTGIGIAKEFIPFLFDDFKQESTGLRRSHEGSGLGLAITKKLVDMMGGNIEIESVKGLGSAFSVRFDRVPIEEVAAAQQQPRITASVSAATAEPWETEIGGVAPTFEPAPAAHDRQGRDLLLIEDNQQNAYMAKFMLEGYAADVATTPEEALELCRRFQYGVLLVDINLGTDSSGIDLLRDIREIEGYEETPGVAVTAYALPGDRERFLNEGFSDYVSKPYRKETLRAAVEKALAAQVPAERVADLDVFLEGGSFDEPADGPAVETPEASSQDAPRPVAPEVSEPTEHFVQYEQVPQSQHYAERPISEPAYQERPAYNAPPQEAYTSAPVEPMAAHPPQPSAPAHSEWRSEQPGPHKKDEQEVQNRRFEQSAPQRSLEQPAPQRGFEQPAQHPNPLPHMAPPANPAPTHPPAAPGPYHPPAPAARQQASPDEFLPADFKPGRTAFPPEVARIVEEAAEMRAAQQRQLRRDPALTAPSPDPAAARQAPPAYPHDDPFRFVDIQPQRSAGDGSGRSPEDPRG